jgi:hypothetical protein
VPASQSLPKAAIIDRSGASGAGFFRKQPMSQTKTGVVPSALPPSEAELADWNALSREEQIARFREFFAHPDCEMFAEETAEDIIVAARQRAAARRG